MFILLQCFIRSPDEMYYNIVLCSGTMRGCQVVVQRILTCFIRERVTYLNSLDLTKQINLLIISTEQSSGMQTNKTGDHPYLW